VLLQNVSVFSLYVVAELSAPTSSIRPGTRIIDPNSCPAPLETDPGGYYLPVCHL